MGRALWLGVLAFILALAWWLARSSPRAPHASAPGPAEPARRHEIELASADVLDPAPHPRADVPSTPAERDGTRRARLAPERGPEPPLRGVVHGRLRVAETGDPIQESMAVFLRTLDLGQKEHLVTRSDGTFTSTQTHRRGVLLARVRNADNRELADHEGAFDPALAEEWPVLVPTRTYPTFARGRVIDARGAPLGDVRVQLVPLDAWLAYGEHQTDVRGKFELQRLRAGRCRIHLQGLWMRSEPLELELHAGPNDLGDLVLAEPRAADLVVRFVCSVEASAAGFPEALLVLKPSGSALEVPFHDYLAEDLGGGVFELRLARVPAGECSVRVESLDGRTYEPERFAVTTPAAIEIRVGGTPRVGQTLRVRDASSGESIRAFGLWGRRRGLWSGSGLSNRHDEAPGELDLRDADRWVVMAEGYRAQRRTSEPGSSGVVEVALERGWSRLFVFEDVEGDSFGNYDAGLRRKFLAGVEVQAEGRLAGSSDDDGQFVLEADEEPATIEFYLSGWRVVREAHHGGLRLVGLARSP